MYVCECVCECVRVLSNFSSLAMDALHKDVYSKQVCERKSFAAGWRM